MIDINELRRLTQAVVKGWGNCDQAWLDQSEDATAAVVGHIDEDGETYPVATIDCDQYYAAHQSLPLAKFYASANPAAISELLDRLEAAESDGLEQARLNGMGGEREAALLSKLEAAEKERDFAKAEIARLHDDIHELTDERDALQAKIADMEQQEPECEVVGQVRNVLYEVRTLKYDLPAGAKLYALPGAQPAPSVPDGWLHHAARMATLARKLREPDWCLESIREMQGELRTLEEAALAAAPKPEAKP